jgi:internalin A
MHAYIHQKTYWRNGVVLTSENGKNRALVKADIEDKKIFIYVAGRPETRSTFLAIIRADFRKIHASISKLTVKEKIPIPGHPDVVADYEHLLTLEELGDKTFIPEGLKERVNVRQLLHGIESESLRIKRQIEDLQQQWDLLSENLSRLEKTKILETKVDERIRIEKLIEKLTAERQQIEQQLNDLETKFSSIK